MQRFFGAVLLFVAMHTQVSAQTVRRVPAAMRNAGAQAFRSPAASAQRTFRPIKQGPHTFYGTITGLNGNTVVVRTRHQRLIDVDATTVFANGTYSGPLFVGKLVTVDGTEAANGVFTAAHISRMTNLNALPDDH